MIRFSLKEMICSVTLVAVGTGIIAWLYRMHTGRPGPGTWVLWFACGPLIEAGIFLPFKRPWLGVLVGVAVQGLAVQSLLVFDY